MNAELLRAAGQCLHGKHWQVPLSKDLGVNPRTVRYWHSGKFKPPDSLAPKLVTLLEGRRTNVNRVLPRLKRISLFLPSAPK